MPRFTIPALTLLAPLLPAQATVNFGPPVNPFTSTGSINGTSLDVSGNTYDVLYANNGVTSFQRSDDAGATWTGPITLGSSPTFQPVVRRSGTLLFAAHCVGNGASADLVLQRSITPGSFLPPRVFPARSPSNSVANPFLFVDPHSGNVHLTWRENTNTDPAFHVMHSVSTDQGASFSSPVDVSMNAAGTQTKSPTLTVTQSGRIFAAFLQHNLGATTGPIVVKASDDLGLTWQPRPDLVTIQSVGLFGRLELGYARRLEADHLYAAYTDLAGGPQADLLFRHSTDDANSFSLQNVTGTPSQADRNATLRCNGEIVVLGAETIDPATSQFTALVATSGNGGASFTTQLLPNVAGAVSQTSLGYDGNRCAVARVFGSPSQLWTASTNRMTRFCQERVGGCGAPGNPTWFARGTLCNDPQAVLDTQTPGALGVIGLATGLATVPFTFLGCTVDLDLATVITDIVVTSAAGQAAITIPSTLPPGLLAHLQVVLLLPLVVSSSSLAVRNAP
ncbi:MAG: sialidase family protein [Planctomycetota bacterium]